MPSLPMLPIQRLIAGRMHDFPPGTLLVGSADKELQLALCFTDPRDPEPRNYCMDLNANAAPTRRFDMYMTERSAGIWLAVREWMILVDPLSSYSGMTDSPRPGDAFISEGVPGIVGNWNHTDGYVSTSGTLLDEPQWSTGYVGFRGWSICLKVSGQEQLHTIESYHRDKS